ncbi:MAG: Flp pilus assembly protein CpaB [Candidatus Riflebacteria bacterium]|nr:Flp pilus assembly protein CpaB [Candidatus Riflebacteria bacterium]
MKRLAGNIAIAHLAALVAVWCYYGPWSFHCRKVREQHRLRREAGAPRLGWVQVVRAARSIRAHERIRSEEVFTDWVPPHLAPAGSILLPQEVRGRFALRTFSPGELITESRIARNRSWLQLPRPASGRCCFSLRMPGLQAVSGFIRSADFVDILATIECAGAPSCRIVVSKLEVLRVEPDWPSYHEGLSRNGNLDTVRVVLSVPRQDVARLLELERRGASLSLAWDLTPANPARPTTGWTLDLLAADRGATGVPGNMAPEILARNRDLLRASDCLARATEIAARPPETGSPAWVQDFDRLCLPPEK